MFRVVPRVTLHSYELDRFNVSAESGALVE